MFGKKVKPETAPVKDDVVEEQATFAQIVTEPTVKKTDNKELVEEMFADALDRFFCADSKLVPGEKLCVIRLEDLYLILCDRLGVDPKDTQYSNYAS